MAKCSFCGNVLVKGEGTLFVKKDGTANFFCSNKCQKNALKLKRSPHTTKWTETFHEDKKVGRKGGTKKKKGKKKKRKG